MITVRAPVAMPLIAPESVERFQKSASRTTGPNAEPNPAHASETSPIMLDLGLSAMKNAITATTATAILPTKSELFSLAFFLTAPL